MSNDLLQPNNNGKKVNNEENSSSKNKFFETINSENTPLAFEISNLIQRRKKIENIVIPKLGYSRYISFANQKGGVGKTTSVVNIAAALAKVNINILVIDIDPQGNASTALGVDHYGDTPSTYEVLTGEKTIAECVQNSSFSMNLQVLPSNIDIAGAEVELVALENREYRLRDALEYYVEYREKSGLPQLDYIFIDCPPSLGIITINALVASDEVIIPIQCEYYALEGISQLINNIERIKSVFHAGIKVSGILLTMFDSRTNISNDVMQEVKQHFPEIVFKSAIPRSVRIAEAPSFEMTVIEHDVRSSGAIAYMEVAYELAMREGK